MPVDEHFLGIGRAQAEGNFAVGGDLGGFGRGGSAAGVLREGSGG